MYNKSELESTFVEIINPKKIISILPLMLQILIKTF